MLSHGALPVPVVQLLHVAMKRKIHGFCAVLPRRVGQAAANVVLYIARSSTGYSSPRSPQTRRRCNSAIIEASLLLVIKVVEGKALAKHSSRRNTAIIRDTTRSRASGLWNCTAQSTSWLRMTSTTPCSKSSIGTTRAAPLGEARQTLETCELQAVNGVFGWAGVVDHTPRPAVGKIRPVCHRCFPQRCRSGGWRCSARARAQCCSEHTCSPPQNACISPVLFLYACSSSFKSVAHVQHGREAFPIENSCSRATTAILGGLSSKYRKHVQTARISCLVRSLGNTLASFSAAFRACSSFQAPSAAPCDHPQHAQYVVLGLRRRSLARARRAAPVPERHGLHREDLQELGFAAVGDELGARLRANLVVVYELRERNKNHAP